MALVDYRVQDGIGIIELNNPPVNAYTLDSLKQLDEAIVKARFDENVHVLVLRGAGEKFFSAGADINMLSKESTEFRNQFALFGHETLARLENTPKLVIAAIHSGIQGSQWEGLAFERELLAQAFSSADAAEGLTAYREKRVAKFQGK